MLNIPDAADTQQQTAISNSDVVTEEVPPTMEVVYSSIEVQTASKQTIKKANTLIGSKVFKTFKINDEDNEEKDYEGEVKSLDETTNLYYLVYEHGKEDYLKKNEVTKIIERYNYYKKVEKPVRKRNREDNSTLQCACGCSKMDTSIEFTPCDYKRFCLHLIHVTCKRSNKICMSCLA